MFKTAKILLVMLVLTSTVLPVLADRGVGKKGKTKVFSLNLYTPTNLRSSVSLNLKSGLIYKSSTLGTNTGSSPRSIISYQKGNNVYVLPYKQKIAVPEVKQGYTGLKLIIRSN